MISICDQMQGCSSCFISEQQTEKYEVIEKHVKDVSSPLRPNASIFLVVHLYSERTFCIAHIQLNYSPTILAFVTYTKEYFNIQMFGLSV